MTMNRLKVMMAALALTMLGGSARADDKDQHLKTFAKSIAAPTWRPAC